jgi:hypothetical protein
MDTVYHRIDTGNTHLIQAPSRILVVAMQAEVNKTLKDMKE